MLKDSTASDRDRALIAGHYVFSNPEVKEFKLEASAELETKGIHLERHLKNKVKKSIHRYMINFRLTK